MVSIFYRYLSRGISFSGLSFEYLIAPSTVPAIVKDCCDKIWESLQPVYMGSDKINEEDWINIADKLYDRTNFPNVIGAVDGMELWTANTLEW
jgi:hypothetical protein